MEAQRTKPRGARRATIKDVAAELNVAVSTVSNAYNRPDQLSAALRQRVFETAERIGYAGPDPAARGLRTRSTGTIAVLLGQSLASAYADPVTAATIEGITDALASTGHGLMLVPELPRAGMPAADGVIVLSADRDDPLVARAARHDAPIVLVDHPVDGERTGVSVDDEMAARGAIGHLTGLGHTRLAIVAGQLGGRREPGFVTRDRLDGGTFSRTCARVRGYLIGAEGAGLTGDLPIYEAGEDSVAAGEAALGAILTDYPQTTGILCASDQLASGIVAVARVEGLPIPGRLSVVGFDDTLLARTSNPPLTSVRQPHAEKGRAAARAVLALVAGEPPPAPGRMAPKIVVRGSSGAPGDMA
jgi:DNA-binding LacI/PurR family transcriptional regulator